MSCNFYIVSVCVCVVYSVSTVYLSVKATAHCHCHRNFAKTNYLDNNCFSFERFPICFRCFQFVFFSAREKKFRFKWKVFQMKQEVIHRVMLVCGHIQVRPFQFAFQMVFSLLLLFLCLCLCLCAVHVTHQCKPFF